MAKKKKVAKRKVARRGPRPSELKQIIQQNELCDPNDADAIAILLESARTSDDPRKHLRELGRQKRDDKHKSARATRDQSAVDKADRRELVAQYALDIGLITERNSNEAQSLINNALNNSNPTRFLDLVAKGRGTHFRTVNTPNAPTLPPPDPAAESETDGPVDPTEYDDFLEEKPQKDPHKRQITPQPITQTQMENRLRPQVPEIKQTSNFVEITVRLPIGDLQERGFGISREHIPQRVKERRLTREQGVALARLMSGAYREGARLVHGPFGESGRPVSGQRDVLCWLLEQIYNQLPAEE